MTNNEEIRQMLAAALQLARGPVRGATFKLKHILQVRPDFDEKRYGYRNLRALLEAFPEVVRVDHDGIDIVVHPTATSSNPTVPTRELRTVRADFWRAFTFVDSTVRRFYDREQRRAVLLGSDGGPAESTNDKDLRKKLELAPGNFVEIVPIGAAEQLSKAQEFSATVVDETVQRLLKDALRQKLWFRAFTSVLQRNPQVLSHWKIQWADHVLRKISSWCVESRVDVPDLVSSTVRMLDADAAPTAHSMTRRNVDSRMTIDIDDLRTRVIRAVNAMSPAQLLALSIPIEHMLPVTTRKPT